MLGSSEEREHGVEVMLVEHVARGAHPDEDGAGVAVREEVARAVEDAPARDHVVFIYVAVLVVSRGILRAFGVTHCSMSKITCEGPQGSELKAG